MIFLTFGVLFLLTAGALIGGMMAERDWRRRIIAHGFARWNPRTGLFQWRDGNGWEGEL